MISSGSRTHQFQSTWKSFTIHPTFAIWHFFERNRIFNEKKWRARFHPSGNWHNRAGGRYMPESSQVGGEEGWKSRSEKESRFRGGASYFTFIRGYEDKYFSIWNTIHYISKELCTTTPGTCIRKQAGGIFMLALKLNNKQCTNGITFSAFLHSLIWARRWIFPPKQYKTKF